LEHKKKCEHCGKKFKTKRRDTKFCSANCRNKAAYEKKVKAEIQELAESLELANDLKEAK